MIQNNFLIEIIFSLLFTTHKYRDYNIIYVSFKNYYTTYTLD